ncbi:hypothetical protein ABGV49_21700 [Chromobacterium vaccinii]|uniref:Uncharacterized protein n=1 Tax=Chromobacterium vaccinii TaxID=1108595 RepID=A0ABV0FHV6_9NEIS
MKTKKKISTKRIKTELKILFHKESKAIGLLIAHKKQSPFKEREKSNSINVKE